MHFSFGFPAYPMEWSVPAECQYPGMGGVLLAGHDRAWTGAGQGNIESLGGACRARVGVMYLGSQRGYLGRA